MVRSYKPKGQKTYKKVHPHALKQAVQDVTDKRLPLRQTVVQYDISFSVIYRHFKKGSVLKPQGGQTCLTEQEEK